MRGHSILIPCGHCQTVFRTYASRVREGNGKFCSSACSWAGRNQTTIPLETRLFRGVVKDPDGCWLRMGSISPVSGYSSLGRDGYAHRIALEQRLGRSIPSGYQSLHTCDIRNCIRNDEPDIYIVRGIARPRFGHLWLGTQADNMADMEAKGRGAIGERNGSRKHPERMRRGSTSPGAKLTDDAVREIRHRYATNTVSLSRLGREFGVSLSLVSLIVRRERWTHLEE